MEAGLANKASVLGNFIAARKLSAVARGHQRIGHIVLNGVHVEAGFTVVNLHALRRNELLSLPLLLIKASYAAHMIAVRGSGTIHVFLARNLSLTLFAIVCGHLELAHLALRLLVHGDGADIGRSSRRVLHKALLLRILRCMHLL